MTPANEKSYRQCLMRERGVTARVAGNFISRCKNVEKRLGRQLEEAIAEDGDLDKFTDSIKRHYEFRTKHDFLSAVRAFNLYLFPSRIP